MSEKQLVSACLDILSAYKILAWRNNSGAMQKTYKGKTHFVRFGAVGSPDIIAIHRGRFVGIECKVGYNKQSNDQLKFQKNVENASGVYLLIYTPDELIKYLQNLL
ncbi:MAG TPA: hypothetical protein ENI08_02210 [Candidatus Dependentiae bacterium]|nr:hypothetical protein [Candidatus Dependentiae bacterium]